jgi:hypothetical protein
MRSKDGQSGAGVWTQARAWLLAEVEPMQEPVGTRFAEEHGRESKVYYAALLIVLAALLLPIWTVTYPGMMDYPNHLTRCYILAHYHDNPLWQQRFVVVHDPMPNLAIELVVIPLLRLLPLLICGKLFLSLAALLYVAGCSEVGRAVTGKPNWLALVCAFTFYNMALLDGFVNYIFGIGVFLCAFAFWLRVRNAMTPWRFFLCCLLSIAAFLAHLVSIAILGFACVTIALLDFVRDRRIPNLIGKVAWLVFPVLLMAGFMKGGGRVGTTYWGTLSEKLAILLWPIRSYNRAVDLAVVVLLFACALAMRKGCKVHNTAVIGILLFGLSLITPSTLFTSCGADARYVVPGCLLLILSIEPRWGRREKIALAVALAAMALHLGSITASWLTISRNDKQVLAMGDILPSRARVYVFEPLIAPFKLPDKRDQGFFHLIQFWTISRGADLSTLFTYPGQQPILRRQPVCDNKEWTKCIASFDYIWTYDPPAPLRQEISRIASPSTAWEKVTLWRVNRAEASSLYGSADAISPY